MKCYFILWFERRNPSLWNMGLSFIFGCFILLNILLEVGYPEKNPAILSNALLVILEGGIFIWIWTKIDKQFGLILISGAVISSLYLQEVDQLWIFFSIGVLFAAFFFWPRGVPPFIFLCFFAADPFLAEFAIYIAIHFLFIGILGLAFEEQEPLFSTPNYLLSVVGTLFLLFLTQLDSFC